MATIKVNQGELYCESTGSGEPLVLLHCGFFDRRNWKNQVGPFSEKFKVINYDQRGAGESSVPVAAFSHVEDLRQLLDALGIDKANLVGHSIGAQIAIDFAATYPQRVKKLVALAPTLNAFEWSKDYLAWVGDLLSDLRPEVMTKKITSSSMCTITLADPKHLKDISDSVLHNTTKLLTWKSSEIQWPNPTALQALEKITAKTLIINGDHDSPDILQIVDILAKRISNAKHKVFLNCDHMINFHLPEEFNKTVIQFLSEA